jgi:hypothetical protein
MQAGLCLSHQALLGQSTSVWRSSTPVRVEGSSAQALGLSGEVHYEAFFRACDERKALLDQSCGRCPERTPFDHLLSDHPAGALKIAFAAAKWVGATLDRCQAFCRQELGCLSLSTREL